MGRSPVTVRSIGVDEVDLLSPLWSEFLEQSPGGTVVPAGVDIVARVRSRIAESADQVADGGRPCYRVAVAEQDGEAVGFASFSVVERGLLASTAAVVVDVVHVAGRRRKHGIGTALLREAAGFADEVGATDVLANVPPGDREVNRFFARYGFAPLVVRRTTPIGQLRRRLGVEPRLDARDITVDLTPVERSLRRRVLLAPRRPVRP